MAEAGLDEGVGKLEDFIATMEAVRERLHGQDDLESARTAVVEANEAAREVYARAWSEGLLTRGEERQIEQAERLTELIELHRMASKERLPPAQGQIEEDRERLGAAFDQAQQSLDEHADEIREGLEELHHTLDDLGQDLEERLAELGSAFESVEAEVGDTVSTVEASVDFVLALCARLLQGDQHKQQELLQALLVAQQQMADKLREMEEVKLAAAEEEIADHVAAWTTIASVVAVVVVVVVAIVVCVLTFGAAGPLLLAIVASIAAAVGIVLVVTASATAFGQLLETGDGLAATLGPLLPQLPGVSELVANVNNLLDALNPFN